MKPVKTRRYNPLNYMPEALEETKAFFSEHKEAQFVSIKDLSRRVDKRLGLEMYPSFPGYLALIPKGTKCIGLLVANPEFVTVNEISVEATENTSEQSNI